MEGENELKEIDIKNRTCHYFDDIIRVWDTNFYSSDTLLDGKSYIEKCENILIDDISCKTSTGAKPLRVRFDKIEGLIKIHNRIRYLVLLDYSYSDEICDKIKYLISEKIGITDTINHNFGKIRIDNVILYLLKKYWLFIM